MTPLQFSQNLMQLQNQMMVTIPGTIMPLLICDNYKTKSAFWGIFDLSVTLTF